MNMTHAAIPIFRIFDEKKAREFYCDYLGFTVNWEHRFEPHMPLYMEVAREQLCLHLTEHHGDCTPGATALVYLEDVRKLNAELQAKQYAYLNPGVEPGPGNSLCMEVTDPFNNRLRFMERT